MIDRGKIDNLEEGRAERMLKINVSRTQVCICNQYEFEKLYIIQRIFQAVL